MGRVRIRSLTGKAEVVGHLLVSHEMGQWLELDEAHLPKALPQLVKDGKIKVSPILESVAVPVAEEPQRVEEPPAPRRRRKAKVEEAPVPAEPKQEEVPSELTPEPEGEETGEAAGE